MLRERAETIGAVFCLVDLAALTGAVVAAYRIRASFGAELLNFGDYVPMFGLLVSIWLMLLYRFGLYDHPRGGRAIDDAAGLLKVSVVGFLVGGALIFGLKLYFISRLLIGIFAATAFVVVAIERVVLRLLVSRTAAAERSVLVIGRGSRVAEIRSVLQGEEPWGVRIVDAKEELVSFDPAQTAAALTMFLTTTVVDEVIFAVSPVELAKMEPALLACERLGVQAHVALGMQSMQIAKAVSNELRGIPMLTFTTTPIDHGHLRVKRVIDIIASVALLIAFAPVMLVTAILVKLTSRGPVLFRQVRSGANGRPFVMYKFRSMCENAEALQMQLVAANEMTGPVFKIRNDPRLTSIGGFLRRSSFDELPQLWNVLKGEMSLVGPRPPTPSEVRHYELWQRRRLSMKPGLTCLWQVNGRNEISDFDQWMRLDLHYIDTWSLSLDVRILARTLPALITRRGAA